MSEGLWRSRQDGRIGLSRKPCPGYGRRAGPRTSQDQWQPHPPPQQLPPPEEPEGDLEEPPALAELKADSWMVAFLLEHCGQEISCWRLMTIFSNWELQSSQTYS